MGLRNFLNLSDIKLTDLKLILEEASKTKALRTNLPKGTMDEELVMKGLIAALIFEKPSTRTRFSFDVGIQQMGGKSIIVNGSDLHLGNSESIPDTAKVISRYVDLVMLRTFDQDNLHEFANNSSVPIINGLTDESHPCQVLTDIFTFEENRGSIFRKKVVWAGDGNNVCNSYVEAAGKFGFNLYFYGPIQNIPHRELISTTKKSGSDIVITQNAKEAFDGADLIVTDTWVSMHDISAKKKISALRPYQVDSKKMSYAKHDCIFLHCLPAHRGHEVVDEVIDGKNSKVFDAAENRMHVQKAIIKWVLNINF